ncbi:MAG: hypothetical protein KAJ19_16485 [Gammaproteobacteria bacterium]|nr:hypothetical protein [Gammaproteobacteria bacterium]
MSAEMLQAVLDAHGGMPFSRETMQDTIDHIVALEKRVEELEKKWKDTLSAGCADALKMLRFLRALEEIKDKECAEMMHFSCAEAGRTREIWCAACIAAEVLKEE